MMVSVEKDLYTHKLRENYIKKEKNKRGKMGTPSATIQTIHSLLFDHPPNHALNRYPKKHYTNTT